MLRTLVLSLLATMGLGVGALTAQQQCGYSIDALVDSAWTEYRAGMITAAEEQFRTAATLCPTHPGARTGLGYAALRRSQLGEARAWFEAVLIEHPDLVDALVGLGLIAWRQADHAAARTAFERALMHDPANEEARSYIPRLAPLSYPARTHGDRFEVRTAEGWTPFYVKGVNLGAAVPGRFPSEFPDSTVYARWISAIGEMGANTIRIYTIHPPHFYQALREYNLLHPSRPLMLLHGVWVELPPDDDYDDPEWNAEVDAELRRVVDLVHGRARIVARRGHAHGRYEADVSSWTLGFIVGREWEPHSVAVYNERQQSITSWSGRFLRLEGGTAMDVWLAAKCETMIAHEMSMYGAQRPIAYTNWPTLDPLAHPTEPTAVEEVSLREALGEPVPTASAEYDNDGVTLDAALVHATFSFPAGYFAAYHVYPYYPDFMVLDPGYLATSSSEGPSPYFGYLRDLKSRHEGMPLLVAEYGVPASLGIAHLHPLGWHHGGLTEEGMARLDARMTREIAEAGMAGGAIFAWIDEWFKKSWLFSDFLLPLERNRLWLNALDPEQRYGVIAMEPEPRIPGATLVGRLAGWRAVDPLYDDDGMSLRAFTDEAFLWLLVESAKTLPHDLFVGFDVIKADAGSFSWPDRQGPTLPVGAEFVLHANEDEVRLLADPAASLFRLAPIQVAPEFENSLSVMPIGKDAEPPGLFSGRMIWDLNAPYVSLARADGKFDSLRVITNRRRVGRDTTEYATLGYDRGVLRQGPFPDGMWESLPDSGIVEIRIPWALLNVTDPSTRRVLQHAPDRPEQGWIGTLSEDDASQVIDGIRVVAAARMEDGAWRRWPSSGSPFDVAQVSWRTWDEPLWRERRRPVFDALREIFTGAREPALHGGSGR